MPLNEPMPLPRLQGNQRAVWPADGRCGVCGRSFADGLAYVSAGALMMDASGRNSIHTRRQLAFLNVGFHGKEADMSDSADVHVVAHVEGDQFDLEFCSLACLRTSFNALIDRLAAELAERTR